MIFLLHGENTTASREALLDLKKSYSPDSVSVFDAKNLDFNELHRALETPSLLSDRRLIIIEGKSTKKETPLQGVSLILPTTDVVFWIGDELKSSNKLFKQVKELGGQVRVFKETIPRNVFGLLDALGYKNKKRAFLELHRLLDQGEAPLYLLTMITWQVRNLINVKVSKCQSVKGMNPFVLRKAQSQAKNFDENELTDIFHLLLDAEIKLKTTRLNPVLILDQLVSKICYV